MPQICYCDNPNNNIISKQQLMILVFVLFESVEEFQKYLPSNKTLKERFASEVERRHLKLLSPYRKTIVFLEKEIDERINGKKIHGLQKFISTVPALVSNGTNDKNG